MTVHTGRRRTSASRTGPISGLSRSSVSQARSTLTARRSTSRRRRSRTSVSAALAQRTSRASTRACGPGGPPRQLARSTSAYLARAFRAAYRHRYAAANPVRELHPALKPRPERKEAAYFENDELPRLFAELDEGSYRTVCLTALKTGMRQGELLGLCWGDVDLQDAVIRVRRSYTGGTLGTPKNHERRDVDLTTDVVELLGWWWGECGRPTDPDTLVFPGTGKDRVPLLVGSARRALRRHGACRRSARRADWREADIP